MSKINQVIVLTTSLLKSEFRKVCSRNKFIWNWCIGAMDHFSPVNLATTLYTFSAKQKTKNKKRSITFLINQAFLCRIIHKVMTALEMYCSNKKKRSSRNSWKFIIWFTTSDGESDDSFISARRKYNSGWRKREREREKKWKMSRKWFSFRRSCSFIIHT